MREEEFLPQDITKAIAETRAAWTCMARAEERLINGDLREAKLTVCNLLSSINELEKLRERKVKQDRLNKLVSCLASKGVQIEVVQRKI